MCGWRRLQWWAGGTESVRAPVALLCLSFYQNLFLSHFHKISTHTGRPQSTQLSTSYSREGSKENIVKTLWKQSSGCSKPQPHLSSSAFMFLQSSGFCFKSSFGISMLRWHHHNGILTACQVTSRVPLSGFPAVQISNSLFVYTKPQNCRAAASFV